MPSSAISPSTSRPTSPTASPGTPRGCPPPRSRQGRLRRPRRRAAPAPRDPAGGAPPSPPPGPSSRPQDQRAKAPEAPAGGSAGAVFSKLNKGESVTAGLRKVDKSEMTHKNPSLRAGSTVPDGPAGSAAARGARARPQAKPKPERHARQEAAEEGAGGE